LIGRNGGYTYEKAIFVSLVAAIGGVSVSICTLFDFKEKWNRNRKYAEKLKSELFFYNTQTSNYEGLSYKESEIELIKRIESMSSEENQKWVESNKKNTYKV